MALDARRRRRAADAARRDLGYRCPQCDEAVVLKHGDVVAAHFAHRSSSVCAWGRGETHQHLAAKYAIARAFGQRGLDVSIEAEILSSEGDRRADVLVRHPRTGRQIAIEVQHSALDIAAVQRRTRAYHAAGVAVIWVPTLDRATLGLTSLGDRLLVAERYPVPAWQRFVAAYHDALWFWMDGALWRGWLDDAWIAASTRDPYAGDGWKNSERWAGLTLGGPFAADALRIQISSRVAEPHESFTLPSGPTARFVVDGERDLVAAPTVVGWTEHDGRCHPKMCRAEANLQPATRHGSRRIGSRAAALAARPPPGKPLVQRVAA